ncbi:MAG: tripartite tricarboxylate transporter TctB family protein [Telmatospirillum sp.]|nr:tripartite tricarboxylate transporter TctB family protein [Telmatospirillum sp.]
MSGPSVTEEPKSARADALFALAMMAVALLTMWGVRNQPRAPYDPVGAAAVPFWTAVAVLALASVLLVRVLLKHSTRGAAMSLFTMSEAVDDSYAVVPRFSVYAVVLSLFYVALIPLAGFAAASVLFMLVFGAALCDRTPRSLAIVAVVALLGGVGLDYGFRALLIDLP